MTDVSGITASVDVLGLKEVQETFKRMPAATQRKALRPALRAGANVVKKAAASNVRSITSNEATGLLARSLAVYSLKRFRGNLRMAVMVRKGTVTSRGVRVGLYASVLEYGKENQPPRSWIRKAAREKTREAFNVVAQEIKRRMVAVVEDAKK